MTRTRVAAAPLALLLPLLAGCSVLGPSAADVSASATASRDAADDVADPPEADATLASCSGAGGLWKASGTVVNPTKNRYDYVVTVEFYDAAGQQVDEVKAAPVPALKGGASARWSAATDGSFPTIASCRIGSVYRTPV